jgi:hypothetical protein
MDAAGIGALIGVSVMVCGVCSIGLYERKKTIQGRWRQICFRMYGGALLPVRQETPLLVPYHRKFEMKNILPPK